MLMNDCVTSKERLNFDKHNFYASGVAYFEECCGCGRTSDEIVQEDNLTYTQLDDSSRTTDSGLWYCHDDCYRDSH